MSDEYNELESIVRDGVYISWEAFELARIGKEQMYARVEETYMGAFGITVEVHEMDVIPDYIEEGEVVWLCIPTIYKIDEENS